MNIIEFRNDLKKRMEEENVSQIKLADTYSVNQSSLSRFLKNERDLPARNILALMPFVYPNGHKETHNAT